MIACIAWGNFDHPTLQGKPITYLVGKITPLFWDQIVQPNRLVRSGVVPLSVPAVEAFCRACNGSDGVYNVPVVSGHSPWVRDALENRSQHETVFFAIGTPGSRKFLKDAIV